MFIRIAIPAALVLIVGYGLIRAYPLLIGPSIILISPIEGTVSSDGTILVAGHIERVQDLTLNGAPLLPDENGAFATTLALPPGPVILSLRAEDRFGRIATLTRDVTIESPSAATASTTAATTSQKKI